MAMITLVIAFNLVALLGIVVGLLLQSSQLRSFIEVTYIETDDLTTGKKPEGYVQNFADIILLAIFLSPTGRLSIRKIAALSFLSCTIFLVGMMSALVGFDSLIYKNVVSQFVGSGYFGAMLTITMMFLLLLLVAWPAHFIYDLFASFVVITVWRARKRTLGLFEILIITGAIVLYSAVPIVIAYAYGNSFVVIRDSGWIKMPDYSLIDVTIILPLIMNGPSMLWVLLIEHTSSGLQQFNAGSIALVFLSCLVSIGMVCMITLAKVAANSAKTMGMLADLALRLSKVDAKRVYQVSFTAFAIGNGLCQVFGISWLSLK